MREGEGCFFFKEKHKLLEKICNGIDSRHVDLFCVVTHFCLVCIIIETEDEESESAGELESEEDK